MIDRHYGHLANDSRQHAVALLDALALERTVDAAWTSPPKLAKRLRQTDPAPHSRPRGRRVDARWTSTQQASAHLRSKEADYQGDCEAL